MVNQVTRRTIAATRRKTGSTAAGASAANRTAKSQRTLQAVNDRQESGASKPEKPKGAVQAGAQAARYQSPI